MCIRVHKTNCDLSLRNRWFKFIWECGIGSKTFRNVHLCKKLVLLTILYIRPIVNRTAMVCNLKKMDPRKIVWETSL